MFGKKPRLCELKSCFHLILYLERNVHGFVEIGENFATGFHFQQVQTIAKEEENKMHPKNQSIPNHGCWSPKV